VAGGLIVDELEGIRMWLVLTKFLDTSLALKPAVKIDGAAAETRTKHLPVPVQIVTAIRTCSVQQGEEGNCSPESANVHSRHTNICTALRIDFVGRHLLADLLENVGTSTSHNAIGLDGMLQG
jgi:hypothetical protein